MNEHVNVTTNHYQLKTKPAMKVQSCHLPNYVDLLNIYKCTFMHCWLLKNNLPVDVSKTWNKCKAIMPSLFGLVKKDPYSF